MMKELTDTLAKSATLLQDEPKNKSDNFSNSSEKNGGFQIFCVSQKNYQN
jgi:hypothetical protein